MYDKNDFLKVKAILDTRIGELGLRKTVERYKILEEIYNRNDHFEAEELYDDLKEKNFSVSKATVYNCLDLLVDLGLIIRHQFGNTHAARYERAFGRKQHSHLICVNCNRVLEFCDPRIQTIQNTIAEFYQSNIIEHSLILYGQCQKDECKHRPENQ